MARRLGAAVAVVAFACGTGPARPDAGGDAGLEDGLDAGVVAPLSLEGLVEAWEPLACAAFACARRTRVTAETCARAHEEPEAPWATLRQQLASVDAGRAVFDPDAGARCRDFLAGLDASTPCLGEFVEPVGRLLPPAFEEACGAVVAGAGGAGVACDFAWECAATPAGTCSFSRSPDCSGACVAWIPPDEACDTRPLDCQPGSFCNGSFCVARLKKADGEQCFNDDECRSGFCPSRVNPASLGGVCRTVSPINWECERDEQCELGAYCRLLPPSTGYRGFCNIPAAAGSPCDFAMACRGNQLCTGYFRSPTGGFPDAGVCQPTPSGVGQPCVPRPEGLLGDTGCYADLTCDPATSRCAEAPAVGQPCAMPERRCGLDAWCDEADVCRAKKWAGAAADAGVECHQRFDSFRRTCFRQEELDRCVLSP